MTKKNYTVEFESDKNGIDEKAKKNEEEVKQKEEEEKEGSDHNPPSTAP